MSRFPFAIVGFDLDGTLLDTSGDIAAAVNYALREGGRPALSVAQVVTMIGGGAPHMFEQAMRATGSFEESEFRRLLKLMVGYYDANLTVLTEPYPGVLNAIDALRDLDVKVAVVTNKFEKPADRLLSGLGLRSRFDCVIGGDTLAERKPSAAPILEMIARCGGGSAAYVGDSIYDVQAARNAGVPSVAVSFGFSSAPATTLGADAVIDHFDALVTTLQLLAPQEATI